MQPSREAVEAVGRVDEDHVGGGVGLPRAEPHLARLEQLATPEDCGVDTCTLGEPLGKVFVVAAPGDVGRPDLSRPEPEARGAHSEQESCVMTRPASAGGP